jgi:hypothetical protein
MTDYIRFCMCSVSGSDGLNLVLDSFSFRQSHIISGSAFVQFPAMTDYIRFCSSQLTAAALLQKLVEAKPEFDTFLRKCQSSPRVQVCFSIFESRNPAWPPTEAGGGQAGVRNLSQEVPVQPSSPGIPAAQSSSLGILRTC